MLEVKVDVKPAVDAIAQVQKNQTLNPVLEPITEAINQANREQIETEGERGGVKYRDLRPGTVRERIRLGYPGEHPILQREGDLKEAAGRGQPASQDGGRQATISYQDERGLLVIHQLDGREVSHLTEDDADGIAGLVADQLMAGL